MKKFYVFLAVTLLLSGSLMAQVKTAVSQKVGYVNTETILEALPEYNVAKEKLQALSEQYKSSVEAVYKVVETMYNNYQKQKASLPATSRQTVENNIISKEKEAKELQEKYFGQGGLMQKKSEELLGPIKERVQTAIDVFATKQNYSLIFDISILQGVIFKDKGADLTDTITQLVK